MADSGVRLTEVLVALSLATDLGFGQPAEHMLRAARISLRVGERLGLEAPDLATLYDVSLLTYVGCPVYGNEAATLFGDDIEFRAQALRVDLAGRPATAFMLRQAGAGTSPFNRARRVAGLMATGGRGVVEQMANHCSAAGELAESLGLGGGVRAGIEQAYARWDGNGVPSDLAGEGLALSARIAHIAEACEVFQRTGGIPETVEMVKARSGTHFDPEIAAVVSSQPGELFDSLEKDTVDEVLDAEPIERPPLTDDQLDHVLATVGDFCDLRCPYFAGHSRGTTNLVTAAAAVLRLPEPEALLLRRASSVHEVGRAGVSGAVWDKPGPLNSNERERMRLHAYFVERIFSRPEPLRRVGLLAATHHERMDGSGYHRAVGGTLLSLPARLLAAADAYHAMTQWRPYREAMTAEGAAGELRREARDGLLDPTAVDAVLQAAGLSQGRYRAAGPSGLTARETDVLALLAQGLPNKGIARRLGISPKTVGNHVEHIYTKLDVSNRAAAAMRAMHHGLVGSTVTAPD
jgi:HD-GYP domain-containing protein (c-di-GMP phosphodiesterase class II)/DNA-binding CsgD family transcriptional regulator